MRYLFIILFLCNVAYGQDCSGITVQKFNNVTADDTCNAQGYNNYVINLSIVNSRRSLILYWYYLDTLREMCFTPPNSLTNHNVSVVADCQTYFVLASYTGNNCNGNLCEVIFWDNAFLPVEMSSFKAYALQDHNRIEWTTLSEVNNSGFEGQKSKDGVTWEKALWIWGNGTTNEIHNWAWEDYDYYTYNYYRIKQVDYDGSFEYSDIIYVERDVPTGIYTEIYDFLGRKVNKIENNGVYIFFNPKTGENTIKFITNVQNIQD